MCGRPHWLIPAMQTLVILVALSAISVNGQGMNSLGAGLAPSTTSASTAVQQCLEDNLKRNNWMLRCSTGSTLESPNSTTRDGLTNVLRNCLSVPLPTENSTVPVRVLTAAGTYSKLMATATAVYAKMTGIPILIDAQPFQLAVQARIASIRNADQLNLTHEMWVTSISSFGDGYAQGAYKDLTQLVGLDRRLRYETFMPNLRSATLQFENQVLALPFGSHTYHLAYRKDMFAKYNWTVPRTWRELVSFATQVNGTEGMPSFCGVWGPCFQLGAVMMRYVLATMVQTHGATQGWLFEPESMALMLKSAAMKETLDIIMGLYKVSPPDLSLSLGCPAYGAQFTSGQCLMAAVHPLTFKYSSHPSNAGWNSTLHSNLGLAPWPGSDVVIDVPTDTLVPCDPKRCPFASRQVREDGSEYYMNESPGQEALILAINSHATEFRSFFTFSALSYITSPEVSDQMVFHPMSESLPTRTYQLDPDRWIAAGFEKNNTLEYCRDNYRSLHHPNVHQQFSMRGCGQLMLMFFEISQAMFASHDVAAAFSQLTMRAQAIFDQAYGGNTTAMKQEYWKSINRKIVSPPFSLSTSTADADELTAGHSSLPLAAIIVPIVAVVALAASLAWLYVRSSGGKFMGQVRHPGPGPKTTLLVTDIENSTSLWEQLDPSTVDAAVKMHNGCIRTLAAEHLGYESVWEGDSFIIAFPTPKAAVQFAVQAQLQLMKLNWPAGLLASEMASEVWAVAAKVGKKLMLTSHLSNADLQPASSTARLVSFGPTSPGSKVSHKVSDPRLPSVTNTICEEPEDDSGSANAIPAIQPEQSELCAAPDRPQRGSDAATTGTLWFQSQWQVCSPKAPGAVCLFRGLRVRIGLHAGVAGASDIQFNAHMRRWHYTGPTRVTSNAVASAGHGGCIMLSSSTASLLGTDAAGVLTDLPSNCQIYHMGTHVVNGVEDPTDLLMVLPTALRGRLAVQQEPLRSVKCVLPGILDTPVGGSEQHGGLSAVGVQVSSLGTLLYWNAAITRQAIRTTLACFQDVLIKTGGTLVEDGLSLVLTTGKTRLPVGAALPDMTVPGRLLAIFTQPSSAVQFALQLRQAMTKLDWDTELLQHELCERMGHRPGMEMSEQLLKSANDISGHGRPSTAGAFDRSDTSSSHLGETVQPAIQAKAVRGSYSGSQIGNQLRSASKAGLAAKKVAGMQEPQLYFDASEVSVSDEQDTASVGASSMYGNRPAREKSFADEASESALSMKGNVRIIKPTLLSGLRTRTAIVQGPMHVAIATRSSGRAVFTGKTIRQLAKILEHMKAGQIGVHAAVFNKVLAGHCSEAANTGKSVTVGVNVHS